MIARPLRVKLTRATFIEQIPQDLKEKYTFDKIPDRPTKRGKIDLICPTHGTSQKQVQHILAGSGCKQCGIDDRAGTNATPYKRKVQRLLELFPQGLLDLYQIDFGIRDSSIVIQCETHGEVHLGDRGQWMVENYHRCPECYLSQPEDRHNPKHKRNDFERYTSVVRKFTEISWEIKQKEIDSNSLGRSRDYHLDHKFSVKESFNNNIPPYIVGHWVNLQILDSSTNTSKGAKCDHTKKELFEKFQNDYANFGLYY